MPCKITPPSDGPGRNSGYPSAHGTLRAAMLFVDFSDAPAGRRTPKQAYDRMVPGARRALRRLSYGELRLSVTPHLEWVRAPKSLREYGFASDATPSWDHYEEYIDEAIQAADPAFDFSKYEVVYVISGPRSEPPEAYNRHYEGGFRADGNRIDHAVTLTGFGDYSTWPGVVHETGHVLGLPDLYHLGGARWDRFVGPWDVMSNAFLRAPMLSWTRRSLGWLRDRDFRCVRRKATVKLTPVARSGGLKGAVVRTGRNTAYVIEARTDAAGAACPDQGVLVYRVDTSIGTGSGPVKVLPARPGANDCGRLVRALFKPSDSGRSTYRDKRVAVDVLRRDGAGYRVRVVRR
jgi:M6 family metalloprotease-like protein